MPTDLQRDMRFPERFCVAHPFNPVYLLPLVELVGGQQTSTATIAAAREFFTYIGMHPLHVRKELPGHLTDRLQEALWREILHIINDGIATTGELDEAIVYGPGLRWAAMGTNLIYHLAGGESGMRHMLAQFGPCLKWPWTKLAAPELTGELIDRMVAGTQQQAAGRSIRELERLRDDYLVAIQQVLREFNIGAGATLRAIEERLYADAGKQVVTQVSGVVPPQPLLVLQTQVRPEWIDYNGHLTDSRYVQIFGNGVDALYRKIGADAAYRAAGKMFYTVECHVVHLGEAKVGEPLYLTTQILSLDAKRLHLFHRLHRSSDNALLATGEQMHLHVDTAAAKASPMDPAVYHALHVIAQTQASLPAPPQAGRRIAM